MAARTEEKRGLQDRFAHVIANWWAIMQRTKQLNALSPATGRSPSIFPIVVAAPRYFAGLMPLGGADPDRRRVRPGAGCAVVVRQCATPTSPPWRATVERLTTFHRAIEPARAAAGAKGCRGRPRRQRQSELRSLQAASRPLALPGGATMRCCRATPMLGCCDAGESVVLTGRSGSGKSTLFRALAGIWPFGRGEVRPAAGGASLFLPQRPYIPLGTLRHAVSYPCAGRGARGGECAEALTDVGLGGAGRRGWTRRRTGRSGFRAGSSSGWRWRARCWRRPDWLFLDEATASLDPESRGGTLRHR